LQLLYLDSYYFYAPNPRVVKLKHKLSRYKLQDYKLLYNKFSSPQYFADMLAQTLYTLQKALNMLSDVLSGRTRRKRLDKLINRLIEIVGDERAAMIEFIVFILQNPDAESKVRGGYCKPRRYMDRETALALLNLGKTEAHAELTKRHTSLYRLYEDYMLCRAYDPSPP